MKTLEKTKINFTSRCAALQFNSKMIHKNFWYKFEKQTIILKEELFKQNLRAKSQKAQDSTFRSMKSTVFMQMKVVKLRRIRKCGRPNPDHRDSQTLIIPVFQYKPSV